MLYSYNYLKSNIYRSIHQLFFSCRDNGLAEARRLTEAKKQINIFTHNTMKTQYKILSWLSVFVGSVSLFLFFHFILLGPLKLVAIGLNTSNAILLNLFLSTLYFTQHSAMVRKSVRRKIEPFLPKESFYAFHSITSGVLLSATVLLWQQTDIIIYSIAKPYIYLSYFLCIIAVLGLLWAITSLSNFDPFGRKQISNYLQKRELTSQSFVIRGPYKFTRHPFYFFILAMIWLYPIMTIDRLIFAITWSGWIVVGTILEEKDLVEEIGEEYKIYQSNVPMLIPYKLHNNIKD